MTHLNHHDGCADLNRLNKDWVRHFMCPCCQHAPNSCRKKICAKRTFVNEDGQTLLHRLCQDPTCSMEEVRDLVATFRKGLEQRDIYGRTPIFYAIKKTCSNDVVKLLFDCFPDAILFTDLCGDCPLYLLYHSSQDYHILEHVLRLWPSLALYKENTFSAQSLVTRICAPWTAKQLAFTRTDVETNATLKDRWTKLVLTVRAAHACTKGQTMTQPRDLHAALEISCPTVVICHFAQMYPEQASMTMESGGDYPLHYFLSRSGAKGGSKAVVRTLIACYPQAVNLCARNGQLPINLAIATGMKWQDGVIDIVYSGPQSLDRPDPKTRLVPFLQAAADEICDLSSVYHLLRENPAVIASFQ